MQNDGFQGEPFDDEKFEEAIDEVWDIRLLD